LTNVFHTNASKRSSMNSTATPPAPLPVPQIPLSAANSARPAANVPPSAPANLTPRQKLNSPFQKKLVIAAIVLAVMAIGAAVWIGLKPSGPGKDFVSGNGRIEATEIDVATKLAGRVQNIMVDEGDFVRVGDPLAQMQTDVLDAERDEAQAQAHQAVTQVASAEAQVAARESDTAAAQATVAQRNAELDAAQRRKKWTTIAPVCMATRPL
jgi:HlyD family secretion protein